MDWRFNTIWFEQLQQSKVFCSEVEGEKVLDSQEFRQSEYATIWHLKKGANTFGNIPNADNLLYLQLNWANINDLVGIDKYKNLKRLELHYCTKLLNDVGIEGCKDSLEFLHINQSKKFKFTEQLLQLRNLRVLCLNSCAPIESLNFLNHFPNLIDFRFVDTNILDGNLKPIIEHPTIRSVGFLNKRHYNYKSEKIGNELKDKFGNKEYKVYVQKGDYATFRYDY